MRRTVIVTKNFKNGMRTIEKIIQDKKILGISYYYFNRKLGLIKFRDETEYQIVLINNFAGIRADNCMYCDTTIFDDYYTRAIIESRFSNGEEDYIWTKR